MILDVILVSAGYVAAVYTWPKIRAFAVGAATEAANLRAKAAALEAKVKAYL